LDGDRMPWPALQLLARAFDNLQPSSPAMTIFDSRASGQDSPR
jgi:hypothetical protein